MSKRKAIELDIRERLAESYDGLSTAAQAALGCAITLAHISEDAFAEISDIKAVVKIDGDAWEAVRTELKPLGLWATKGGLVAVGFRPAVLNEIAALSAAPTNRPTARDWAALRVRVFKSVFGDDEPNCLYCGMTGVDLVLDHHVPLTAGGSNHWLNLIPACVPCNSSKGGKLYAEWVSAK